MKIQDNSAPGRPPALRSQRGVGLIEVLIAAFILAVGMLSIASTQLAAKRASYEATQRSIAVSLARDIVERMRSNSGQLDAYVVDNIGDEEAPLDAATVNCTAANCTPDNLAEYDLTEWESLLMGATELLAGGSTGGLIAPRSCITNVDGAVTVAIAWRGVSSMTNPTESTCGEDVAGLYDDPDGADGNNLKRRLLVMSTFIGGG